jgi:hypothetical protein
MFCKPILNIMNIKSNFTYIKTTVFLFLFFNAISAISQPFKPVLDQISGQYITGYPDWPAKGYVITNSGDSISGTITKSSKKFGFFLQSITIDGKEYKAGENKSFGFLAYLESEKHYYKTNNAPCGSIPTILRYDSKTDPKKGKKVFMWKMVDEPGLIVYQNPGFGFSHTTESGSTRTKTDHKEVLKQKLIDKVSVEVDLGVEKSFGKPTTKSGKVDLKLNDVIDYNRDAIYDDCGKIIGYKNEKGVFRTDRFSHKTSKGLEEDYFYNAYYLVAKDGSLIKLSKKNYLDQWAYLWKGCKEVDNFSNGVKNYDKIKKFMRLVSVYAQQCN